MGRVLMYSPTLPGEFTGSSLILRHLNLLGYMLSKEMVELFSTTGPQEVAWKFGGTQRFQKL